MRIPTMIWLLLLAPLTQAQVFTWVDEEGNTHYSDRPPADAEVQELDLETRPMTTVGESGLRPAEQEMLKQIKEDEQQRAAQRRERRLDRLAEENRALQEALYDERARTDDYYNRYYSVPYGYSDYDYGPGDRYHKDKGRRKSPYKRGYKRGYKDGVKGDRSEHYRGDRGDRGGRGDRHASGGTRGALPRNTPSGFSGAPARASGYTGPIR